MLTPDSFYLINEDDFGPSDAELELAELIAALERLCINLAQAAALSWAFELGGQEERDSVFRRPTWWPGCGRDAK